MPRGIPNSGTKKESDWERVAKPKNKQNRREPNILALDPIIHNNFKPFTDFKMENPGGFTSEDVYLKAIRKNGAIIGTLINADEDYIYGIIAMDKIIIDLEIDLGENISPELAKKYETAFNTDKVAKRKYDIENQRVIKMEKPRYNKYLQKISQKVNPNAIDDYDDEEEDIEEE